MQITTDNIIQQLKKLFNIAQNESAEKLMQETQKIEFPLLKELCCSIASSPKDVVKKLIIKKRLEIYHTYAEQQIDNTMFEISCLCLLFADFVIDKKDMPADDFEVFCYLVLAFPVISIFD